MRKLIFQNSANIVTTIGIILAFWNSIFLIWDYQYKGVAFIITIIVALTDFIDGWLARRWHIVSLVGVSLDRGRDKLLICPLFAFFIKDICLENNLMFSFVRSALWLILLIELGLIITWFVGLIKKWDVSSHRAGKIKQVLYVIIVSSWLLVRYLEQKSYFQPGLITRIILIALLVLAAIYAILSVRGYLERYINISKAS